MTAKEKECFTRDRNGTISVCVELRERIAHVELSVGNGEVDSRS